MKIYPTKWTDRDFDSLSWHDNRIYSMRILNPRNSYDFDLVFEIDHILEWVLQENNTFEFVVAPARLTFSMVDKLVVDFRLTYKEDWEIDEIQRIEAMGDPQQNDGSSEWRIKMQSLSAGKNTISFRSKGFIQELTGEPEVPAGGQLIDGF